MNDILSELEKQVAPLEKQSETAKIYLKKKEELKTLDVNMFLLENNRLREQLQGVEEKHAIASSDLSETSSRYEGIREEYEKVQNELESLDKQIEEARGKLSDTGLLRGKLEGEINVLKEQIHSAEGNMEHLNSRLKNVQHEIDLKTVDKDGILTDKKEIDEQVAALQETRDTVKLQLEEVQKMIEGLNNQIEAGKNTIIDALNQRATIKSQLGRFDTMMEQVNIRKAELTSRLVRAKSDEAEQLEQIRQLEEQFEAISSGIKELNDKQTVLEERLSGMRNELSGKDQKLRDMQVVYHQEKAKLESLSNLTERYEGYGGSVKRVMEQKEQTPGIVGVVADIIKVDKKYETAIETALGGNIQNIVTDDEDTAKKMIAFLKKNKGGRATFLPLTSIKNPQEFKTPEVLSEKGVIGMADALVTTEKKYKDVAKAMLGRIVVIDNVDNAVKIAKKFNYGIRMVTIEGELLVPGGAISGGAFKNNSNLLGRRREIEELEGKVKKQLADIDGLLDDIEKTKEERNRLRVELEETKGLLQDKFIEQNTARLNVIQAQEKKSEALAGFDELKAEEQGLEKQITQIKEEKAAVMKELSDSEQLEKNVEVQISEFQRELEEKRKEESDKTSQTAEWDLEVEKMLQRQEFHKQNLDRIDGEILRFTNELTEIKEGIEKSGNEMQSKKESIAEIEKTIVSSHETQSDTEILLQESVARREELNAGQKNFLRSGGDCRAYDGA